MVRERREKFLISFHTKTNIRQIQMRRSEMVLEEYGMVYVPLL
jgi:hypothetical protein